MASKVIMKKGGSARLEIEDFQSMDHFTVPAGFKLEKIIVENAKAQADTIKLGDYVDAVAEVVKIVQTGDVSANGDITVTLRGGTPVLVPVLGADSIAQTVTKMASATYPGWSVAESLGTTVTWTANVAGLKTGVTSVTGPAGFAKTGPTLDFEGADPTCGEEVVASGGLVGTIGSLNDMTLVKTLYAADTDVYMDGSATGTIVAQIQKLF